MSIVTARMADSKEDYKKIGISKDIAIWEDGTRTNGVAGTYEWWYFDCHLKDGTTIVIVFYTKSLMSPSSKAKPYVKINITSPNQKTIESVFYSNENDFSFSKEKCDVRIGKCYFKGDLKNYDIYFIDDKLEVKIGLSSNVQPWRPESGHLFFGKKDEYYFAWLPSVPEGNVKADVTINGITKQYTGSGYHDHNWGNCTMLKLMSHWYWGRAKIGNYQLINSYIYAEKKYGNTEFPIFMVAKDGKIIGDNPKYLKFTASNSIVDKITNKPVHQILIYDYDDGQQHFKITYEIHSTIVQSELIEQIKGVKKILAKSVGFDGAYHRFLGKVTFENITNGVVKETLVDDKAVWELMYFGHNQEKKLRSSNLHKWLIN